jgi:hypothetical protein
MLVSDLACSTLVKRKALSQFCRPSQGIRQKAQQPEIDVQRASKPVTLVHTSRSTDSRAIRKRKSVNLLTGSRGQQMLSTDK